MQDKIHNSLSNKLILRILLMAAPIFLMALGFIFIQSRRFIRQEAQEHAFSVLNTTVQRVRNYMTTIETATESNTWLVKENFHPDSLLSITRRIVMLNSHVNSCSITAAPDVLPQYGRYFSAYSVRQGDTIITAREAEYDYFSKPWYKIPADSGKACWVDTYDDYGEGTISTSEKIASYCKPVKKDGQLLGVIATDLSLRELATSIKSADISYPNAYLVLLGNDGRYFIHPDSTKQFNRTIFTDINPNSHTDIIALGHEMTSGKQGMMHVTLYGKLCHVCYRQVPGTHWSMAFICPDSDILQSYHLLAYIIAAIIFIGLLGILLLCRSNVRHAMRPIIRLVDMSQQIAAGNYDDPIPQTRRNDVIGRLQNSFATMLQSLNFHMGGIRHTAEATRKRNEELTQATRLAEEAVKQKNTFIQNVTHQIRTPLNIILGFSQILRDSVVRRSAEGRQGDDSLSNSEEVENIKSIVKHNAAHLNRMVLMLYDSSDTAMSEELTMKRDELMSCNDIARESISYLKKHFPDVPIKFYSDLPDSMCIYSNSLYLMRTIRELLYNSAKYSDGKHLSIFINETDSTVRYIVEDVGAGLSEESYDLIFTPFTKVDDLSEGLGLGLPLSKRHALSLGGDLRLDTTYTNGCRFILDIPKIFAKP